MNRIPVLVRNIKHLTDARYFAAMGVDWMSISLTTDPLSFSLWHTLKDWIAGVKLAAEIDHCDEMLLSKAIIDASPEGIICSAPVAFDLPSSVQLFIESNDTPSAELPQNCIQIKPYEVSTSRVASRLPKQHALFLQAEWKVDTLSTLLSTGYTGGICFSGGEEKETGMRDYELMDELLDLLQP